VVRRHVEELGFGIERRRLLVLAAKRRRADAFGVDVRPVFAVEYFATTSGRPVFMSTWVAQLTCGSYFSATSRRPVTRSMVYPKPLRSKCTSALVGLPFTLMSARIISLMPSKSHSSYGVI
jgi:hypothetical protein